MSGIYAVQGGSPEALEALAPKLAAQMAEGGEPINHYALVDDVLLGCVGLDGLKQGVFPRWLEACGLWVLLEGELHGCAFLDAWRREHPEITTDAEVFARLYRDGALADALEGMNGAYFVCLYDPASKTLTLANDRHGMYPVYWAEGNGRFCASSRVLGAVLAEAVPGALDLAGIAQLLTIDDLVGEVTLVEGVACFPQATLLTRREGRSDFRRYWWYDRLERKESVNEDEHAERLGALMIEGTRRQCGKGRTIGITLSGGLDSRCCAGAANRAGVSFESYTFGRRGCADRRFAADVARLYDSKHHEWDYEYERFASDYAANIRVTEGLTNYTDCHMMNHRHKLQGTADIILNGYGGDQALGGSFLRSGWMKGLDADALARTLYAWRNELVPDANLGDFLPDWDRVPEERRPSAQYREAMRGVAGNTSGDHASADMTLRFYVTNRTRRMIAIGTTMMRLVTESASPIFDYDLHEAIFETPAALIHEHRIHKRMMRAAFPETLTVRWERTLIPAGAPEWQMVGMKAVLKACRMLKSKTGWAPLIGMQPPFDLAGWFRGPLREWLHGVVHDAHPEIDAVLRKEAYLPWYERLVAGEDTVRQLGAIVSIKGFAEALEQARRGEAALEVTPERVPGP